MWLAAGGRDLPIMRRFTESEREEKIEEILEHMFPGVELDDVVDVKAEVDDGRKIAAAVERVAQRRDLSAEEKEALAAAATDAQRYLDELRRTTPAELERLYAGVKQQRLAA